MMLTNQTRDTVLLTDARYAKTFWTRFLGLMGRAELPAGQGLVIEPGGSIHMFFMRFAIDAIFVDKDWKILHISHSIKPWRISRMVRRSKRVIEVNAGLCASTNTQPGDVLALS